jgi:hypothetical protein
METNMTQVVSVIEQALNMASTKGAFGLKDAAVISQALDLLKTHFEPAKEPEVLEAEPITGKK